MQTSEGPKPEITAKWKTALDLEGEHFGTITLGDEFRLDFPMLHSFSEIPVGTSVLWGMTGDLSRCTVLTLPFGPPGQTTNDRGEKVFSALGIIRYLFVGQSYIADPVGDFVSEIVFTPRPNEQLRVRQLMELIEPHKDISEIRFAPSCDADRRSFASAHFAYFETSPEPLFETLIQPPRITISAWIGGSTSYALESGARSRIGFCLRFQAPRDLETALEEALTLCLFLSFITHQYVYPTDFHVRAAGEDERYRLHFRHRRHPSEPRNRWVGHTLVLPDEQPARFCESLQRWYATNDTHLRSRHLYRYSLEEPNTYSTDRFLAVFQAVEGVINKSGYQFLTAEEMEMAKTVLTQAFPCHPKLESLIGRLKSSNTQSLKDILKQELRKIFAASGISPSFSVDEFVDRISLRRNKSSHGGPHLDKDPFDSLAQDTLLLTAIYLILESGQLGLDVRDALTKFRSAVLFFGLPLTVPA